MPSRGPKCRGESEAWEAHASPHSQEILSEVMRQGLLCRHKVKIREELSRGARAAFGGTSSIRLRAGGPDGVGGQGQWRRRKTGPDVASQQVDLGYGFGRWGRHRVCKKMGDAQKAGDVRRVQAEGRAKAVEAPREVPEGHGGDLREGTEGTEGTGGEVGDGRNHTPDPRAPDCGAGPPLLQALQQDPRPECVGHEANVLCLCCAEKERSGGS